ncbi:hypothetical protein D3C78_832960 [compost metagenome]
MKALPEGCKFLRLSLIECRHVLTYWAALFGKNGNLPLRHISAIPLPLPPGRNIQCGWKARPGPARARALKPHSIRIEWDIRVYRLRPPNAKTIAGGG